MPSSERGARAHTGAAGDALPGASIDTADDGRWVVHLRTAAGALQQYTCASRGEAERFAALFAPRPARTAGPCAPGAGTKFRTRT